MALVVRCYYYETICLVESHSQDTAANVGMLSVLPHTYGLISYLQDDQIWLICYYAEVGYAQVQFQPLIVGDIDIIILLST